MSDRPTGITILAVLAVIGGILNLAFGGFVALLGPAVGTEMAQQTDATSSYAVGGAIAVLGIGLAILGLLYLITAYGLFTLKGWAWLLAVIVQVLSVIVNGIQVINSQAGSSIVAVLIAGAILFYLFRPHVKAAFGRS